MVTVAKLCIKYQHNSQAELRDILLNPDVHKITWFVRIVIHVAVYILNENRLAVKVFSVIFSYKFSLQGQYKGFLPRLPPGRIWRCEPDVRDLRKWWCEDEEGM